MNDHSPAPVQWAQTVSREHFTGLREAEDRILFAGVPGGSRSRPGHLGSAQVVLMIVLLVAPVCGLVAFMSSALFVQDGVLRIFRLDLESGTRLWIGAVCFTIAVIEAVLILVHWLRGGREKDRFLAGWLLGIAVFAGLAVVFIAREPGEYLPDGFDLRIVPAVATFLLGAGSGLAILLGSRRDGPAVNAPAEPSGIPVSRDALDHLSPHDTNALFEARRYVLQTLLDRGLINDDVDELDRKPLGSFE